MLDCFANQPRVSLFTSAYPQVVLSGSVGAHPWRCFHQKSKVPLWKPKAIIPQWGQQQARAEEILQTQKGPLGGSGGSSLNSVLKLLQNLQ